MLENLMINLVTIQAPGVSKGSSGAEKDTWTNTVTAMPCRVIDAQPSWRIFYGQKNLDLSHQVFTTMLPTIKAGYQLIWGTKILRVIGVYDLGGAGKITRVDCMELLTGA